MELEHKTQVQVAEARHLPVFQFRHIHSVDEHAAPIGLFQCAENLEQGGLSGTARTDDTHDFALLDVEVYAFQHLERTEGFGDVACVDHI